MSALGVLVTAVRAALTIGFILFDLHHIFTWGDAPPVLGAGAVLWACCVLCAGVAWLRTRWWCTLSQVHVRHGGLIFLQETSLDLAALQSVDVQRPLVARILGLAQLRLTGLGVSGTAIGWIHHDRAVELRAELTAAAEAARQEAGVRPAAPLVAQLPALRLAGAALLASTLETLGILLAAGVILVLFALGVVLLLGAQPSAADAATFVAENPGALTAEIPSSPASAVTPLAHDPRSALLVGMLFLSRQIFSAWRRYVERGWRFQLIRDSDPRTGTAALTASSGLFDTRSDMIPQERIQELRCTQHPSWRPFRWWTLESHTGAHGRVLIMPPSPLAQVVGLCALIAEGSTGGLCSMTQLPRRSLLVTPWGRVRALHLGESYLAVSSGAFIRRTRLLRTRSIQSLHSRSGLLLGLLGLRRLHITFSGEVHVRLTASRAAERSLYLELLRRSRENV